MMKAAFLFPGQGSQVVGMGSDVAGVFPAAAGLFEKANEIVGYDLRKICFEGPVERLNWTTVSQPAIFVTSAAILDCVFSNPGTADIKPGVTAGLSLGEYTALYAAGLMLWFWCRNAVAPCKPPLTPLRGLWSAFLVWMQKK